ncbi:MAG: M13 family metallopeptidase [Rickettsiales bacterium]|jgi:putative endopeptidase|nr:M13 family metallopeptidase [Rickettsiales bacterium]
MRVKIINIASAVAAALAMVFILQRNEKMSEGIRLENLDAAVRPQDDFYDFATAGWRKANPLRPEFSRFGAFDKLGEEVLVQVDELITGIAKDPRGDLENKIATIYNGAMNYDKRNADGIKPVAAEFAEIDAMTDWETYLGRAHRIGGVFFNSGTDVDMMDSGTHIFGISQTHFPLSRDYLLDKDDKSARVRSEYGRYIGKVLAMFRIVGTDAREILEYEIEMAKGLYPKEKLREPLDNYHKMSVEELKKRFAGFDWDKYFKARGAAPEVVDVGQPEPVEQAINILIESQNKSMPAAARRLQSLRTKDQRFLRAYLKYRIANGAMTELGDAQYDLAFDFYGRMVSGKEERRPKWKDAANITEGVLGEAIGQLYVKKYFPPEAKKRMVDLVENLRRAYADRLGAIDWMSPETKKAAQEKLAAFGVKIGYPDKWRDYSKLELKGDSLYADLVRSARFDDDWELEKLRGGRVDRTEWHMTPQTVNAYFSPVNNEIVFPAAILQPPFFDMTADDAFNYGAIGSVIGHEMTHGFDDSGRRFDKDGNMKNWWTDADTKNFDARAKVMKDWFDKIEVAPGLHANGEFTLGENLADYGGLTIAFDAYKKYGRAAGAGEKYTPEQRFFIAYGGAEIANIRPDEVIRRTKVDEHSLSEWRVNGILPHVDAWQTAFGVADGDKMWLAPDKRVRLW